MANAINAKLGFEMQKTQKVQTNCENAKMIVFIATLARVVNRSRARKGESVRFQGNV